MVRLLGILAFGNAHGGRSSARRIGQRVATPFRLRSPRELTSSPRNRSNTLDVLGHEAIISHLSISHTNCIPLLKHDFQSHVGYWVHMTAHRFERAMNEELAGEGITYRQGQVLAWLALDGDLAQCELAERMNVEPPSLVTVLDRMERDGLIARASCPNDRRRKVIRPTEAASPVWSRVVKCANRVRERSVHGLTRDQERELLSSLRRVHQNLDPATSAVNAKCSPASPAADQT